MGAILDVGPSSNLDVLITGEGERTYTKYGDCVIPFYACVFLIIGLRLPFIDFETKVLKHLMVATSQLHHASWRM